MAMQYSAQIADSKCDKKSNAEEEKHCHVGYNTAINALPLAIIITGVFSIVTLAMVIFKRIGS